MSNQRWPFVAIGCGALFFFGIVRATCTRQAAQREREQNQRERELMNQALQDYQVAQTKAAHKATEPPVPQPPAMPSGITADLSAFDYEAIVAKVGYWVPSTHKIDLAGCQLAIAIAAPRDKVVFTATEACGSSTKAVRSTVGAAAVPLPHGKGTIALKKRIRSVHTVGLLTFEINAGLTQQKNDTSDKNLETALFKNTDAQLAIAAIPDGYPPLEITNAFIDTYDNSEACELVVGKDTLTGIRAFDGSERTELYIFRSQAQRVAVRVTYQSDQYERAMHHVVPTLASLLP